MPDARLQRTRATYQACDTCGGPCAYACEPCSAVLPDTPTMAIRDVVPAEERAAVAREMNRALRAGEIVRASSCAWCGSTEGTMDGHHPDYARPLMVVWLCRPCHLQHHRTYRDESRMFRVSQKFSNLR